MRITSDIKGLVNAKNGHTSIVAIELSDFTINVAAGSGCVIKLNHIRIDDSGIESLIEEETLVYSDEEIDSLYSSALIPISIDDSLTGKLRDILSLGVLNVVRSLELYNVPSDKWN